MTHNEKLGALVTAMHKVYTDNPWLKFGTELDYLMSVYQEFLQESPDDKIDAAYDLLKG